MLLSGSVSLIPLISLPMDRRWSAHSARCCHQSACRVLGKTPQRGRRTEQRPRPQTGSAATVKTLPSESMLRILLVSLLMYSCWAETLETDTENLATDTPDADRMLLPSGRTPRIRLIVMLMSSRAWQWETSDQQRFSDKE